MKDRGGWPSLRVEDLPAVLEAVSLAWGDPDLRERISGGIRLAFSGTGRYPDPEMLNLCVVPGGKT